MALIYCPECESEVSESAACCVKCAFPINNLGKEKLEKLKQLKVLLDDGLITKDEFATLNKELQNTPIINTNQVKFETNFSNSKKKKNSNSYIILVIIGVVFLFFAIYLKSSHSNSNSSPAAESVQNQNEISTNDEESDWQCSICGKTFKGPGYEAVAEGVWKLCKEPMQCLICSPSCGRKHDANINKLLNLDNSDGRIYDKDDCSLCKGTGIEKNHSSLSNEYGRVCPMCDGKGKRGY